MVVHINLTTALNCKDNTTTCSSKTSAYDDQPEQHQQKNLKQLRHVHDQDGEVPGSNMYSRDMWGETNR